MATLTSTTKETVTIDGEDKGTERTYSIAVTDILEQAYEIPITVFTNILTLGAAKSSGTVIAGTTKYLRISNLDGINYLTIRFNLSAEEVDIKLLPGCDIVLYNDTLATLCSGGPTEGVITQEAITSIHAMSNTAACRMELFVGN